MRDFENGIRWCVEAMCIMNGVESKRLVRVFERLNDHGAIPRGFRVKK